MEDREHLNHGYMQNISFYTLNLDVAYDEIYFQYVHDSVMPGCFDDEM